MTQPVKTSEITLRKITSETVRSICNLSVREDQKEFVAPNAISLAEARFSEAAWFRAVYADETPVGFAMLHVDTRKPDYFLWRFMIDGKYQGLGFGRQALALVVEHVKTLEKARELQTSVVQAEGGPQPFYESFGFKLTGDYEDGEAVMSLPLEPFQTTTGGNGK